MCVLNMLHLQKSYAIKLCKKDLCYDKQRTFVYVAEAAHARYPDRDPYWNSIAKATYHATVKDTKHKRDSMHERQHKRL